MKNLLGAHVSIAGGVSNAPGRGVAIGCNTIQIFTKNATRWKANPLAEKEIAAFKETVVRERTIPVVAHDSYLINLAAAAGETYDKSIAGFRDELDRCAQLDIPWLVFHPGNHKGEGEDFGIARIAESLIRLFEQTAGYNVKALLENTAGSGTVLGYRFEHLREIMDRVNMPDRIGVCFDTCHAFAAGYDFRTKDAYEAMWRRFDDIVGLDEIKVIHANDSMKDLGSRVDRHDHIGKGFIGETAFRLLMNDERFVAIPKIIETPLKEPEDHIRDIRKLKSFVER